MRVAQQVAFILHRRPYRNTSLLLEVLTQDHGRLGLVARGAASARSRLKGMLQPFVPLLIGWSGRGELPQLTAAEEVEIPIAVPAERVFSGLYANELLIRLLYRFDPHPEIFTAYRRLLVTLARLDEAEEPALRIFEKHLLAEIGYGLLLDSEASSGAPVVPDKPYRYVLDLGPVAAENGATGIPISGKSLLALHNEILSETEAQRQVKRLTRAVIALRLNGKPLRTRELAKASLRLVGGKR